MTKTKTTKNIWSILTEVAHSFHLTQRSSSERIEKNKLFVETWYEPTLPLSIELVIFVNDDGFHMDKIVLFHKKRYGSIIYNHETYSDLEIVNQNELLLSNLKEKIMDDIIRWDVGFAFDSALKMLV
jgi:hypothetical protein